MWNNISTLYLSMDELTFLPDATLCLRYVLPKFASGTNT